MFKRTLFNKEQWSWIMYDWANSAYSIVITTAILPIYYKAMTADVMSDTTSTLYWTIVNTASALCVALFGPLLGSISDIKGYKKRFFVFLLLIGILSTISLALVPYGTWGAIVLLYFITVLGFSGTNIFYDSFLVDVATEDEMDVVSANGFAYGYIGSTIPFIISIAVILFNEQLGISSVTATKFSFLLTGIWWAVFSIPMIKNVKQKHGKEKEPNYIKENFLSLFKVAKKVYHNKVMFVFLLAYFFYIDGVNTIIKLATIVGSDLGIDANTMLVVLVLTQLVAFPSTIVFGMLSRKFKGATLIIFAICIYVLVCVYAMFFLKRDVDFYTLGAMIGLVQGGIQSLSRSYFAKLIDKESSGEYFGFYNVVGKFSAILGPTLYGVTFYLTSSVALAIGSVLSLFIIGLTLFIYGERILKKL